MLPEKYTVKIVSEKLSTVRNEDGHRSLNRELTYEWRGESYSVQESFKTDFSSYPRAWILYGVPVFLAYAFNELHFLWYWIVPILYPSWQKTDYAGVGHDKAWRDGDWNMSLWRANVFWFCAALSGRNVHTKATVLQGLAGYLALSVVALVKTVAFRVSDLVNRK